MKNAAKFLIIIVIGVILLSSGCINQQKTTDTDKDGYADNVDAFPNDANFHQKVSIWGPELLNLQKGQGTDKDFNVESNVKVIVVNWSVIAPTNLSQANQHNITLDITMPSGAITTYHYDTVNDRNLRFSVNPSSVGTWTFSYYYSLDSSGENVTVSQQIYGLI
jgi:hypothetical protein